MAGVDALVEATTRWYLAYAPDVGLAEVVAAGREGFERLEAVLPELGGEERRARREQAVKRLTDRGVPESVARAHALSPELVHAPDIITVARATGRPLEEVAQVFFAVGAELRLDWLETELARVRSATRMQRWALQAVREDAYLARRELALAVLAEGDGRPADEAVERFAATREAATNRLSTFLRALARDGDPDLAGLTLAVRQLRAVVE
jgi:glutamate dehydrogenase